MYMGSNFSIASGDVNPIELPYEIRVILIQIHVIQNIMLIFGYKKPFATHLSYLHDFYHFAVAL